MSNMWKVPEIWTGGRCFIIGGGRSIPKQFDIPDDIVRNVINKRKDVSAFSPFMKSIHNEHIIGINVAYKLGGWVDIMFFGDDSFWKDRKDDILTFPNLKVTCSKTRHPDIKTLGKSRNSKLKGWERYYGLSDIRVRNAVRWNLNSGTAAIDLAVKFGAKQIILLGFDMNYSNGHRHFHREYRTVREKSALKSMERHLACFPFVAEDAKRLGVEILNCSPESAIKEFPRMPLKEVL